MPIRFLCDNPDCRAKMVIRDEAAGKRVKCPRCQWVILVPSAPPPGAGHEVTAHGLPGARAALTRAEASQVATEPAPPSIALPGGAPRRKPNWLLLGLIGGGAGGIALLGVAVLGLVLFFVVRPRLVAQNDGRDRAAEVAKAEAPDKDGKKGAEKGANADKLADNDTKDGKGGNDDKGAKAEDKELPADKLAEYAKVLNAGLQLKGKVRPAMTQANLNAGQNQKFQEYTVELELINSSTLDLALGKDFLLYESNNLGNDIEGVCCCHVPKLEVEFDDVQSLFIKVPDNPLLPYRLFDYVLAGPTGQLMRVRDKTITAPKVVDDDAVPPEQANFGKLPAHGRKRFRFTLGQSRWLLEQGRAKVRVVLPEITVGKPPAPLARFRLAAHFQKPQVGTGWTVERLELVPLVAADLAKTLESADQTMISRICAASWLMQRDPVLGKQVVLRTATSLREGELLAACMQLMIENKIPGGEKHAIDLLGDIRAHDAVRRLAAYYLGAVRHQPAFDHMVRELRGDRDVVAIGAMLGLGEFGDDAAANALLGLLQDNNFAHRHETLGDILVRYKLRSIAAGLQALTQQQNHPAMRALAETGAPASFDFFVQRARQERVDDKWRVYALRGLRHSGGKKATPIFLELLDQEPEPGGNPDRISLVVRELSASDDPAVLPAILERVKTGKLRPVQVLALTRLPGARPALIAFARTAQGDAYRIAISGIADRCPAEGFDLLKQAAQSFDTAIKKHACRGLGRSRKAEAIPLLIAELNHPDINVKDAASLALRELPPGPQAGAYLDAVIAATDNLILSDLTHALTNSEWNDPGAIPRIKQALQVAGGDKRYYLMQLLRHLADNAMGPETFAEFDAGPPQEWVQRWMQK
jgi:HEAT repeat protein